MKYGLSLPPRGLLSNPDTLSIIARRAEELGYELLIHGDHILAPRQIASTYPYTSDGVWPGSATNEAMEQLTVLAFVAGQTSKIKLVTSVMIVPYRNPLVAARTLTTLDILSKGRLIVGVGVGWMREEFEALGLPAFEKRGAVTDEYLRVFRELWTNDQPSFEGEYCRFSNISFFPKPVQKPHPPIWIGGESNLALRRTALLGNGWHFLDSNPQHPIRDAGELGAALQRLESQLRLVGRELKEIEIVLKATTYQLQRNGDAAKPQRPFVGSPEKIAADIRNYAATGMTSIVLDFVRRSRTCEEVLEHMEEFATRVRPAVDLG